MAYGRPAEFLGKHFGSMGGIAAGRANAGMSQHDAIKYMNFCNEPLDMFP